MLQSDSICHTNASRVHQTSIVEHFYKIYPPQFLGKICFSAHEENHRSTPLNSKAVENTEIPCVPSRGQVTNWII
jgi:hypothetical protein